MKTFRTVRTQLAPRWLTEGDGGLVGYALDLVKDAFVERVRLGLLARFPFNDASGTTTPGDALSSMGRDRRVVRGINESDASYATRLLAWLDDRKTAGNPFTLMQKLAEYTGNTGCVFKTVDVNGNWYVRAADGTRTLYLARANWDWDGDFTGLNWSRFWVIVHPGTLWTNAANWGSGQLWGANQKTWGTSATYDQAQTVRAIVADWKPAGTTCVAIIVALDAASFVPTTTFHGTGMPDGTWIYWAKNSAGVEVPARLSTARFFDGV